MSYATPTAWAYLLNVESTYDWKSEQWNIPLNLGISKVTRIGDQLVCTLGGVRYYLESTDAGPEGWGLRFSFTLLFPK